MGGIDHGSRNQPRSGTVANTENLGGSTLQSRRQRRITAGSTREHHGVGAQAPFSLPAAENDLDCRNGTHRTLRQHLPTQAIKAGQLLLAPLGTDVQRRHWRLGQQGYPASKSLQELRQLQRHQAISDDADTLAKR